MCASTAGRPLGIFAEYYFALLTNATRYPIVGLRAGRPETMTTKRVTWKQLMQARRREGASTLTIKTTWTTPRPAQEAK